MIHIPQPLPSGRVQRDTGPAATDCGPEEERLDQVGRRVTIADVAEKAGVSKTAASFAFNNPDRLNSVPAPRILDIAHARGSRPGPVARMLAQRKTGAIGVLAPQDLSVIFTNPFFGSFSA